MNYRLLLVILAMGALLIVALWLLEKDKKIMSPPRRSKDITKPVEKFNIIDNHLSIGIILTSGQFIGMLVDLQNSSYSDVVDDDFINGGQLNRRDSSAAGRIYKYLMSTPHIESELGEYVYRIVASKDSRIESYVGSLNELPVRIKQDVMEILGNSRHPQLHPFLNDCR